jgi:hypothetical protein
MKKLLYILPLILLTFSCKDDPVSIDEIGFSTVYAIDRYSRNGTFVEILGDGSKKSVTIDEIQFYGYPNPVGYSFDIILTLQKKLNFEIFIETSKGGKKLLDAITIINYPYKVEIPAHTTYFKESIYKMKASKGSYNLGVFLDDYKEGVYNIIYEDSDDTKLYFPIVIEREGRNYY